MNLENYSYRNKQAKVHAFSVNLIAYGTKGIPEPTMTYGNEFSRFFVAHWEKSRSIKRQAMEHHNIHIGQLIRAQLKADQRSVSWLAREIGCTRNHLYKVFRKPSLEGELLLTISWP